MNTCIIDEHNYYNSVFTSAEQLLSFSHFSMFVIFLDLENVQIFPILYLNFLPVTLQKKFFVFFPSVLLSTVAQLVPTL